MVVVDRINRTAVVIVAAVVAGRTSRTEVVIVTTAFDGHINHTVAVIVIRRCSIDWLEFLFFCVFAHISWCPTGESASLEFESKNGEMSGFGAIREIVFSNRSSTSQACLVFVDLML